MKKKGKVKKETGVVIYQAKTGAIELKGDFQHETIWATQAEMAGIFDVTPQNITLHLGNIFKDKELEKKATCKEFLQVQKEGNREIRRKIKAYNLDAIIAVGYRINSLVGTKFRQWATKTLRTHITKGYTINPKVVKNNYAEFQKAVENIRHLLPAEAKLDNASVVELVSAFADTWLSLEAYDKGTLTARGVTKKAVTLTGDKLTEALGAFKIELVKKGEATDLFGRERGNDAIAGIVGNVMQSFGGKSLYSSVEEKAAHLLYFVVKNHPFTDGNKRNGAYSFVWFLNHAGILDRSKINPPALTALTLMVAESDPKHKERVIKLILQLLKK